MQMYNEQTKGDMQTPMGMMQMHNVVGSGEKKGDDEMNQDEEAKKMMMSQYGMMPEVFQGAYG
jgi:hypothetical protein